MSKKVPVVVDCDGGADTLWGLAIAASSPNISLQAVTVCAGKETVENSFANLASYAALLKLQCPIVKGSARSVLLKEKPIWGKNGPDAKLGLRLPAPLPYAAEYAWDALYNEAKKAAGELTVVCFGPMTNLAIALFKYQDLAPMIKQVVFVGGSYDFGNYSSVVEINMATDPEASRAVFRSGIPKVMVGFNSILKSALNDEQIRKVCNDQVAGELFLQTSLGRDKLMGRVCYGAALGMAALADLEVMSYLRYHVTMETKSGICRGRTTPLNMYSPRGFEKDTDIAMEVNMDKYIQLLARAIGEMDVKNAQWI